jgi:hypothetical protein
MKTTVLLPDTVFRRAKAETAMQGRTLRAFIMDAVVHELERSTEENSRRKRVRLPLIRSSRPGSLQISEETVANALMVEDLHALA